MTHDEAIRQAALAEAARLVCGYCADGDLPTGKRYRHRVAPNRYNRCQAENIWRAAETRPDRREDFNEAVFRSDGSMVALDVPRMRDVYPR